MFFYANQCKKIISIADGKTIYQNLHATTTKRTLNTPDAKSAAIICNFGTCEELFYINTKNELHIIDIYNNEDNYIYEYNPWYKTKIPNIYSKIKVNSFKEENSNLVISYVDGSSEVLSGEIYIK